MDALIGNLMENLLSLNFSTCIMWSIATYLSNGETMIVFGVMMISILTLKSKIVLTLGIKRMIWLKISTFMTFTEVCMQKIRWSLKINSKEIILKSFLIQMQLENYSISPKSRENSFIVLKMMIGLIICCKKVQLGSCLCFNKTVFES